MNTGILIWAIVAMVIAFVLAVCLWGADSEGRRWRLRAGSWETSALIAQKECDAWKAKALEAEKELAEEPQRARCLEAQLDDVAAKAEEVAKLALVLILGGR